MSEQKPCPRCLLAQMDKGRYEDIVLRAVSALLENDRASEKICQERLQMCRSCDNLISGTCLSCGCYVEIRAATKKGRCPKKKW